MSKKTSYSCENWGKLKIACENGDRKTVLDMLRSEKENPEGLSVKALSHVCSTTGSVPVAEVLINDFSTNPNENDNEPCLISAARNGYYNLVELLLVSGADPSSKNEKGESASSVCRRFRRTSEMIEKAKKTGLLKRRVGIGNGRWRYELFDLKKSEVVKVLYEGNNRGRRFNETKRVEGKKDYEGYKNRGKRDMGYNQEVPKTSTISICTYNVLAQKYVRRNFFPYAEPEVLEESFRLKNLKEEIAHLSQHANVICLQELEEKVVEKLVPEGYSFVYKKRTGSRIEGCGIFYNPKAVKLVSKMDLEYNIYTDNRRDQTDNIGQLVRFEILEGEHALKQFCVGNTHLYYRSQSAKRLQFNAFRGEMKRFAQTSPYILVGDLNARPDSMMLRVFEKEFFSAYDVYYGGKSGDLYFPFTSVDERPKKLDHILVPQGSGLKVVGVLEFPKVKILAPNEFHSSDHLPLLCVLSL